MSDIVNAREEIREEILSRLVRAYPDRDAMEALVSSKGKASGDGLASYIYSEAVDAVREQDSLEDALDELGARLFKALEDVRETARILDNER